MQENTDQNNSEYGHFLQSVILKCNPVSSKSASLRVVSQTICELWAASLAIY